MTAIPADGAANGAEKTKLSGITDKRLVRFATLFAKALIDDSPETIHDLRVASRRLQQVFQILPKQSKTPRARKLVRTLRKVRRAFGTCRNLDVNIGLLQARIETTTANSTRQAWEDVRLWLIGKRAGAVEAGKAELRQHELVELIERLQSLLEKEEAETEMLAQLWERTREAWTEWIAALETVRADRQVQTIHAFRIAGKRLRYRTELLAEIGNASVEPLVSALKSLQDDLGNWHDRSVLRDQIGEFIGRPGFMAEAPGKCRALLLEMERDKQRDRAAIDEIMTKAEKLAAEWKQFESKESAGGDTQESQ